MPLYLSFDQFFYNIWCIVTIQIAQQVKQLAVNIADAIHIDVSDHNVRLLLSSVALLNNNKETYDRQRFDREM